MGKKLDVKKVFIAGGTGFLGYYSTLEFIRQGAQVGTLSLPDIPLGDWFPKEVEVKYGNLFEMKKEELMEAFRGYDVLVYAVGPDDRVHAPASEGAYGFFHKRLVESVVKVFEAARDAGVKKAVVTGSYLEYFDKVAKPELNLSENHPYIRVRGEQSDALIATGSGQANGGMDVVILQLPYIFGCMPEREPLWKEVFLDRFAGLPAAYYTKGGTCMIHVTGVAEAVVAAAFYGQHGDRLPIGHANHKHSYMINKMLEFSGAKKRFRGIPLWMATIGGKMVKKKLKKNKQEAGLDYARIMKEYQGQDYYIPEETIQKVRKHLHYDEFGYKGGKSIEDGIKETVLRCYPHRFDKNGNLKEEYKGVNPIKAETAENNPLKK